MSTIHPKKNSVAQLQYGMTRAEIAAIEKQTMVHRLRWQDTETNNVYSELESHPCYSRSLFVYQQDSAFS
jgi:hypothetical protein